LATLTTLKRKKGEVYMIGFVHPKTKKYVRRIVRCSKKEAELIVKKIEVDIALGQFNIESKNGSGYYWSQLETRYLAFAELNKAPKTVKRDRVVFKSFTNFIGSDPLLTEISTHTIESFKAFRLESGVKPSSVALEIRHLKAVFYKALHWEMVEKNPVVGVKQPKHDIVKVRYLLKDEVLKLLEVIDNPEFKRLVIVYLHTGARRFELLNLSWDDVDFNKRQIILNGKGSKKRFIPMNKTLLLLFTELKETGRETPFSYRPNFVSHKIQQYYKAAEIKGANLHSLRKTFGSTLLQGKLADIFMVSKLLGHENVRTTQKYYVDFLNDDYREPVEGLDLAYDIVE